MCYTKEVCGFAQATLRANINVPTAYPLCLKCFDGVNRLELRSNLELRSVGIYVWLCLCESSGGDRNAVSYCSLPPLLSTHHHLPAFLSLFLSASWRSLSTARLWGNLPIYLFADQPSPFAAPTHWQNVRINCLARIQILVCQRDRSIATKKPTKKH